MLAHRSRILELWLRCGIGLLCVFTLVGCASIPREWPPAPEWLWQDKSVEKLVFERYDQSQSTQSASIEDRAAIELLVRDFINKQYADKGGTEKTRIKLQKIACAFSYECMVLLDVHLNRWDGSDEDRYYLVFNKSWKWSLRHIYPYGGARLRY